jgi:hypothetical protein
MNVKIYMKKFKNFYNEHIKRFLLKSNLILDIYIFFKTNILFYKLVIY